VLRLDSAFARVLRTFCALNEAFNPGPKRNPGTRREKDGVSGVFSFGLIMRFLGYIGHKTATQLARAC